MIYLLEIPLKNYYGDGLYQQPLYIEAEKCPTKDQVLGLLNHLHERDSQYPEYLNTWWDAIQLLAPLPEWPNLTYNQVQNSLPIKSKLGFSASLSLKVIKPYTI